MRDGDREAGTHLPQDAGLKLSPDLGLDRDDLCIIIYGISVPSLSCPLDLLAFMTFGRALRIYHLPFSETGSQSKGWLANPAFVP